jgi:hypothetical protein
MRNFSVILFLYPMPAIGTKLIPRRDFLTAPGAGWRWNLIKNTQPGAAGLIKHPSAAVALQEAFPPLNRDHGNKEDTHIMVQAFEPRRWQAALWTGSRLVIYFDLLGLYPADENEGISPPLYTMQMNDRASALKEKIQDPKASVNSTEGPQGPFNYLTGSAYIREADGSSFACTK